MINMVEVQGPAPRPCESCPYRKDTPSGVWAASEYVKLAHYDRDTGEQPTGLFQCHQHDANGKQLTRVCAGWCGTHDMNNNLAVRIAVHVVHSISFETYYEILDYVSPVPLFSSGREAAVHGMREIENPSPRAQNIKNKIIRLRSDIKHG
jgi:hypothetical protein